MSSSTDNNQPDESQMDNLEIENLDIDLEDGLFGLARDLWRTIRKTPDLCVSAIVFLTLLTVALPPSCVFAYFTGRRMMK